MVRGGEGPEGRGTSQWRSQRVMEGSIRRVCVDSEGICAFAEREGLFQARPHQANCPLFLPRKFVTSIVVMG